MQKAIRQAFVGVLLGLAACGGDDDDDNGGNPSFVDGTLTALVDGTSFAATLRCQASITNGVLIISSQQATGTGSKSIDITLNNVTAAGTFSITATANNASYAEIVTSSGMATSWLANAFGGSGSVVITQLSSTHVTGTFTFTAEPISVGATGNKTVTSGNFSIELNNIS